jgi:hypothetical protein
MGDYFEWAKWSFDLCQLAFMAFVPGMEILLERALSFHRRKNLIPRRTFNLD